MLFIPSYEGLEQWVGLLLCAGFNKPNPSKHRVILTKDGNFSASSTLIQILSAELLHDDGYRRQSYAAPNPGRDTLEKVVKIPEQAAEFLIPNGNIPSQFDTAVILLDAPADSNRLITLITTNGSAATFATLAIHNLTAGDRVFFTGTMATDLPASTYLYVLAGGLTNYTFNLSLTPNGVPINCGENLSGPLRMHYANGFVFGLQARDPDGSGNNDKTLFPGQAHTIPVQIGLKTR